MIGKTVAGFLLKKNNKMKNARTIIQYELRRMSIGQEIVFDRYIFVEAYLCGWPSIYNSHEESFLSCQIGSAWGVWRVRFDFEHEFYIVSKHEESKKRYYVDPDRAYLFTRLPDNTLQRK